MLNPPILRLVTILVTIIWVVFLLYLGLIPELPEAPVIGESKVAPLGHFGVHLVLASLVFVFASPRSFDSWRSLLAMTTALTVSTILGLIVEGTQSVTEGRSAEYSDVVFNFLGAFTGSAGLFVLSLLKVNYSHISLTVSGSATALMTIGAIVLAVR